MLIINTFSCTNSKYNLTINKQYSALVLRGGKWILNMVDCPSSVCVTLQPLAASCFKIIMQDGSYHLVSAKGIIIPEKNRLQTNKATLHRLKLGTSGYNYFIAVGAIKFFKIVS